MNHTTPAARDERLHLTDLPAWPELAALFAAALLALAGLYLIEEAVDRKVIGITASSLVRGVPPGETAKPVVAAAAKTV